MTENNDTKKPKAKAAPKGKKSEAQVTETPEVSIAEAPDVSEAPTEALEAPTEVLESPEGSETIEGSEALEAPTEVLETSEGSEAPLNEPPLADVVQSKSRWYIVHTYSGFEQRVEATIKEMIRNNQAQGLIDEVIVPTERVIELGKGGTRRTTTRKFYPGYIMLRMTMTDESWHLVQSIPKVTGFVGGKNRPVPMKNSEAEQILSLMEIRQEQPRPKFSFERGEEVRVMDGPFGGFNGIVEDVNNDKGKLRVSVSIFGRPTPVELDFIQVSKS